jgi:mono/diheme cytochrome c family protein
MKLFWVGIGLGFIGAFVALAGAGYLYLRMGMMPVATLAPMAPLERTIVSMALRAQFRKQFGVKAPFAPTAAVYTAGAKIYREHCAVCHGLPGQPQTAIAAGEFPKPPDLMNTEGVRRDPIGVTYWKIANGLRLTGMPGFQGALTEEQLWQVTLLLKYTQLLPADVMTALRSPAGH